MAKCIKRAGIIFFAIFVSCLLALGCAFTTNVMSTNNDSISLSGDEIVDNNDDDIVYDFELSGNCSQIATTWKSAIEKSLTTKANVKVKLVSNWLATINEDKTTAFGTGVGFSDKGAISVPSGADITINLNGKNIFRQLSQQTIMPGGNVIDVAGTLTINDSSYNSEAIKKIYDACKENRDVLIANFQNLAIGKIGAGSNLGDNGGGIYVAEGAVLNFNGGMICDNYFKNINSTTMGGAGIYCLKSTVNMNDGIIFNNKTNRERGAGVAVNKGTFNMNGGYVVKNDSVEEWAGGIYCIGEYDNTIENEADRIIHSYINITKGIISHNYGTCGSGVTYARYGKGSINNAELTYNCSVANSSALLVWDYTSEVVVTNTKMTNNYTLGLSGNFTGGVLLCNSKLDMDGVEITDNTYINSTNNVIWGGGVYLEGGNEGTWKNVTIARNEIKSVINDGLHVKGGGLMVDENTKTIFGENVQIYDNLAHGEPSDVRLDKGQKLNISHLSSLSKIGIKLADDYEGTFTNGYGDNNNDLPYKHFFSNQGDKVAAINNAEVTFEKTINTAVYDFVYLENDLRKSYKANDIKHGKNDFDIMKNQNDKVIIGHILYNTSVNTFISNIGFERENIKLYNSNGKLIYDRGGNVEGIDSAYYDKRFELPVGSGWRVETYTDSGVKIEEFYLSVLGDSNGDGRISATDISYLRELANNAVMFGNLSLEVKLACLIDNKGYLTTIDSEIVNNIISNKASIDKYL